MAALQDEALAVFGEARQKRDYIHISDVVRALLEAGTCAKANGGIFNLGYGQSVSLKEMAETIVQVAGAGSVQSRPWPEIELSVETGDFVCNIDQISRCLDWRPEIRLREGLEQTMNICRTLDS